MTVVEARVRSEAQRRATAAFWPWSCSINTEIRGSIADHEFTMERGGRRVAEASGRWLRLRETYGVEAEWARTMLWSWPSLRSSIRWRTV